MLSAIAYFFLFSTWGLGLISWIVLLSAKIQEIEIRTKDTKLGLQQKELLYTGLSESLKNIQNQKSSQNTSWGKVSEQKDSNELIPEKILELMNSSKNHPEVNEIDGSDEILGVRFEAQNYPPVFEDEDE